MIDLTDQDLTELASAGVTLASLPAIRKILARHVAAFKAAQKRAKDAERAKAYRSRLKNERPSPSREHHATVTKERKLVSPLVPPAPLPGPSPHPPIIPPPRVGDGPRAKPKKPLPDGWQPRPADFERMVKATGSISQAEIETTRFRDHHTAHGKLMLNWDAAYRTWAGNYSTFNSKGHGNGTGRKYNEPRGMEAFANFSAKVDAKLSEAKRAADGESQGSGSPVIVELPLRHPRQGR